MALFSLTTRIRLAVNLVALIVLITAIPTTAYSYIMPLDAVLQKTIALSGKRIISVDQDVIFKNGVFEYIIKESWLIEGDKNLLLTATGTGPLKDSFKVNFLYNNKTKTYIVDNKKLSESVGHEFFERYLSIRSMTSFKTFLQDNHIQPELRMSRADGSIAFAIGEPSPLGQLRPQLWIDQDFFRIRKLRTSYESDLLFSDYASYANDQLSYPKTKVIEWAGNQVIIKVRNVAIKQGANLSLFYPSKLDKPTSINLTNAGTLAWTIEEFYKRFR